jgi:phosphoribosylamine---glycine ligase
MTSPRRILIVGSGAREHALAWRLAAEDGVGEVHVAPGNAGMSDVATVHSEIAAADLPAVAGLAREIDPDLVVIGPEAPLAAGLADLLNDEGFATFGPSQGAARLESSKSFCRALADAAGIPMAEGASFEGSAEAIAFARSMGGPVVVKADGLAAGKGVALCASPELAEAAIRAALDGGAFGQAGHRVVVERQLSGREASVMAICDGTTAVALPAARDHKRAYDDDLGPNTGGMGAFSPLDDLPDDEAGRLIELFHRPALAEMARRGTPFRGLLYAGLMLTPDGPRLLEFNVRFGDPEAQAVLPRIDGQLASTLLAAARGSLGGQPPLIIRNEATVAVVLAADGYPANPRMGDEIDGINHARTTGAFVFHGGTAQVGGRSVTNGGRVLTVVGRGADLGAAREQAYEAASRIRFAGMHYRRDIGAPTRELAGAIR